MAEHQDEIPGIDDDERRVETESTDAGLDTEVSTGSTDVDEAEGERWSSSERSERVETEATDAGLDTDDASAVVLDQRSDETEALVRGPLHLDYVGTSHVGLIRKNNQDSGYASPTLLLVADGMGGAAAGDLASAVAVTAAQEHDRLVIGAEMLDALSDTVRRANNKIADLVADDHTLEGMGTTVSGGLFDGSRFGVCHIGDSRIYLIRDGDLERLTHDHSWVQSLVDDGKISEEEAAYHPHRSLLIKVLNGHPTNVPDTQLVELREGDRLVLCSDGLCGLVDDADILEIAHEGPIATVVDDLVEAALQAGGLDNVTVVVADVVTTEPDPPLQPIVLGAAVDTDIPALTTPTVDLGDADAAAAAPDEDPDEPVRPAAPTPSEPDEEDRRYAVTTPPRRRWIARLVAVVLAVAVLVGLGTGTYAWGQTQYYVGAAGEYAAIYRGLPQNLLGIPLSSVYERTNVKLTDLPKYHRDQVLKTISADSLAEAQNTVTELDRTAKQCREQREKPSPPPTTQPPPPPGTSTTPGTPASPGNSGSPGGPGTDAPTGGATSSAAPSTSTSPTTPANPDDCG